MKRSIQLLLTMFFDSLTIHLFSFPLIKTIAPPFSFSDILLNNV